MHYWMIRWGNLWGMRETRPADVIDQMRLHQRVSLPWPLDLQRAAPWPRVRSCSSGFVSPPPLDTLEESWGELDLLRFWFFLLLAASQTGEAPRSPWRRPPWTAVLTEAHVVPRGRPTSRWCCDLEQRKGHWVYREEMRWAQRVCGKR